ncbi:MAG: hypothetical protein KPEEDBHJ_01241 [Anaerolineales bacterium]|nr:hypothetical protein [Anaerolineales bacterium]
MKHKPQQYPSLYVIFTLLSSIRRGIPQNNIWREFRRQGIALKPRLSFWVPLCRQAGLIKETDQQLRVSSYASTWLKKTPDEQILSLLEAWQNSPQNKKTRQFRKKLLWKLRHNQLLTAKDHDALNGLDALGMTANGVLTFYGKYFIRNEGHLPSPKPIPPCAIHEENFIAPLPSHLSLLWRLELLLRPSMPGVYPLSKRALHFHNGDPQKLIQLLEDGMKSTLPEHARSLILKQPSIRIAEGIVLEFSSHAELAQLRRQPVLRKYFEEFLSSQRVLIAPQNAKMVFELLKRRGVYVHRNEDQTPAVKTKRTHFPQNPLVQPVGHSISKLALIEKYKQLGQALDMLYRAPGYAPEKRRITPLAIEQRGEHTYIIAYCQTRRGQRTFRLDRMEIPGAW